MKLICTAFFLALIIASCSRVPDETMDGRGTFYCKVNGEDYFPECFGFACQDVTAGYFSFGDAVAIGGFKQTEFTNIDIYIYIYNVQTNPVIVQVNNPYLENTFITQGCGNTFLQDENDFNLIVTKADLESRVISGTFSGVFTRVEPNHNCIDTIVITDGIFDLPITF